MERAPLPHRGERVASPDWTAVVWPEAVFTIRAPVGPMSTAVPRRMPSWVVTVTARPRVMH